jgi:hypothetical protein
MMGEVERKERMLASVTNEMAGEEGFEPAHAGIKIRCLNQLGDSPAEKLNQRLRF